MIGIISDTHEQIKEIEKAVDIFKNRKVDFVVHCGDLISIRPLKYFEGLKMIIVHGNNNCDQEHYDEYTSKFGWEKITPTKEFAYEGKKFFVYHGQDTLILDEAIKSQKYDYILTGHTHKKRDERVEKTRIINPGSLFGVENSIATLDIKKDELEFIDI